MSSKTPTAYEIARQFSDGFVSAILVKPRLLSESDHWIAGWDAGYGHRKAVNEQLNAYLVSIGKEPLGIVKLA